MQTTDGRTCKLLITVRIIETKRTTRNSVSFKIQIDKQKKTHTHIIAKSRSDRFDFQHQHGLDGSTRCEK